MFFYNLFVYPIEFVFDILFSILDKIFRSTGLSIIGLSAIVTIFTLPLYNLAEVAAKNEREFQKSIKNRVTRIKNTFKGDEQYMILSTFYKQNHYHPIMSLRSSIGLLIQIPFFIAAYHYISNLSAIAGTSFLFIKDLSKCDSIFGHNFNILPIAMTIINIIAGVIYTKGFEVREKLQLFIMAFVFLVLLYTSPSALVLYWTMNNVYSLIKNIFYKLKSPKKALYITGAFVLGAISIYVLFFRGKIFDAFDKKLAIFFLFIFYLFLPMLKKTFSKIIPLCTFFTTKRELSINTTLFFLIITICISLLLGAVNTSNVINSSVIEFSNLVKGFDNPIAYIFNSLTIFFGFFIIWGGVIFLLLTKKHRVLYIYLLCAILFIATIDAFVFMKYFGTLSSALEYIDSSSVENTYLSFVKKIRLPYILCIILICVALVFIKKFNKEKFLFYALCILGISFFAVSFININKISRQFNTIPTVSVTSFNNKIQDNNLSDNKNAPLFKFSKTNKNILLIILDRAINWYLPHIMEQFSELQDELSGFIYYPNTISFCSSTAGGILPIYGGYEYTPENLNNRNDDSTMKEKWNEANKVLPKIFSDNNFRSFVIDSPYTNFSKTSDPSVFADIKNCSANITDSLKKTLRDRFFKEYNLKDTLYKSIPSKFVAYSIFLVLPPDIRFLYYSNGSYCSASNVPLSSSIEFLNDYVVLKYLNELVDFDDKEDTYCSFYNCTSHQQSYLTLPNYDLPSSTKTTYTGNYNLTRTEDIMTYQVNASCLLKIGKFFDYLKQNGVYNNTRIIIVADHGYTRTGPFSDFNFKQNNIAGYFNPLLMEKDFNSSGPLKISYSFTTNADVPYMLTDKVINNKINPYTQIPFNQLKKDEYTVYDYSGRWGGNRIVDADKIITKNGKEIYPFENNIHFTVKDNIFDQNNWKMR